MQTTTFELFLAGDWTPVGNAACLLRIRDAETIFYVEQARQPCRRMREHLGMLASPPQPTRLGRWLLLHRACWRTLQLDLLDLSDVTSAIAWERPSSLGWWDPLGRQIGQAPWEAVHRAEYALIRYHRPCLNDQYNGDPGRTPLPPGYQPCF